MAYFPFFMELSHATALVVGGGVVALGKIEKLIPYGVSITVVAPEICPEICRLPQLTLHCRSFGDDDILNHQFVIAASDQRPLNAHISALCQKQKIPVNVVDDKALCSFIFPALVQAEPLSIGISTGGASPTAAIYLKERITELIPPNLSEILTDLDGHREDMKRRLPSEKTRSVLFKQLFSHCLLQGRPLNEREYEQMVSTYLSKR